MPPRAGRSSRGHSAFDLSIAIAFGGLTAGIVALVATHDRPGLRPVSLLGLAMLAVSGLALIALLLGPVVFWSLALA